MLRQEPNDTKSLPAEQVRVTPEELAAAITRIEARKDSNQRNIEGTIAIGEIVHQLGLDTTPEEVLKEVQAGRAQSKRRDISFSLPFVKPFLKTLLTLGGFSLILITLYKIHKAEADYAYQHTPGYLSVGPNVTVEDKEPNGVKLLPLDQVSDEQPVRVMLGDLFSFTSFESDKDSWIIIKHNGEFYVRGFVDPTQSPSGPSNKYSGSTTIYNSRDWHTKAVPVTLELNSFKRIPGNGIRDDGNQIAFDATDVHPDRHESEKW